MLPYIANVELLSNKIELFLRQFKEMLHVTTRLVILTKQVKLNKHRFIFNLYIYSCIMPKLVTNYITLYLCNYITYFIILHTHLGKKTESKRTARCGHMCTEGQVCIFFCMINPKYNVHCMLLEMPTICTRKKEKYDWKVHMLTFY